MKNLSTEARLVELVVHRVLRRYQERLTHTHRNNHSGALDELILELPRIVRDVRKKVETESVDPDAPSPYDLSARPGRLGVPRSKLG